MWRQCLLARRGPYSLADQTNTDIFPLPCPRIPSDQNLPHPLLISGRGNADASDKMSDILAQVSNAHAGPCISVTAPPLPDYWVGGRFPSAPLEERHPGTGESVAFCRGGRGRKLPPWARRVYPSIRVKQNPSRPSRPPRPTPPAPPFRWPPTWMGPPPSMQPHPPPPPPSLPALPPALSPLPSGRGQRGRVAQLGQCGAVRVCAGGDVWGGGE